MLCIFFSLSLLKKILVASLFYCPSAADFGRGRPACLCEENVLRLNLNFADIVSLLKLYVCLSVCASIQKRTGSCWQSAAAPCVQLC